MWVKSVQLRRIQSDKYFRQIIIGNNNINILRLGKFLEQVTMKLDLNKVNKEMTID